MESWITEVELVIRGGDPERNGAKGENGTGGLLVILSKEIKGNGALNAIGKKGGWGDTTSGGGSGGRICECILYRNLFDECL